MASGILTSSGWQNGSTLGIGICPAIKGPAGGVVIGVGGIEGRTVEVLAIAPGDEAPSNVAAFANMLGFNTTGRDTSSIGRRDTDCTGGSETEAPEHCSSISSNSWANAGITRG